MDCLIIIGLFKLFISSEAFLLNSKELIEKAGISRATLNNYISCGIVPKPEVMPPNALDGAAPRLGYFNDEILMRIAEIQRLKKSGWSMSRIAEHFASGKEEAEQKRAGPAEAVVPELSMTQGPKVSIDEIGYPAYMVNYNFELTWFNDAARQDLLGNIPQLPSESEARSIFKYLLHAQISGADVRSEILRFHFGLAKLRAPKSSFFNLCREVPRESMGMLERLYNEAELPGGGLISQTFIPGRGPGAVEAMSLYGVQFREGILFVMAPSDGVSEDLLSLLARRDIVIRDLVRKRLPVLTHVAVLVADLQGSTKICSELPPEEYFELINQIWLTVDPIFRRYYGTHGKHAGDGMVYYFFPQPDCNYIWNAISAANEMRQEIRRISKDWQLRKGWTSELYLNTGINEGQEWLGTFQSATHVEFTVLGDTINYTARLSDFARGGSIWATKNLLGKMSAEERQRLKYGVRRKNSDGQEILVTSTYSTVDNLIDLNNGRGEKLKDIARLPITEIIEIKA